MDEAKTLIHLSVSSIFSAVLLAVCVSLIATGNYMWSVFARQDQSNKAMQNYAKFTAFDNAVVRGQEIMQLVESSEDIFVIILEGESGVNINNMTIHNSNDSIYYKVPQLEAARDYNFTDESFRVNNTNNTLNQAQLFCKTALGRPATRGISMNNKSHDELVRMFTLMHVDGHIGLGKPDMDPDTGATLNSGTYAAFKTMLVYDTDATSDIVGVVAVREATETQDYNDL